VADVAVILDEKDRQDPEAIGALLLRNPTGVAMPLRKLAEIYPPADASPSCTRAPPASDCHLPRPAGAMFTRS